MGREEDNMGSGVESRRRMVMPVMHTKAVGVSKLLDSSYGSETTSSFGETSSSTSSPSRIRRNAESPPQHGNPSTQTQQQQHHSGRSASPIRLPPQPIPLNGPPSRSQRSQHNAPGMPGIHELGTMSMGDIPQFMPANVGRPESKPPKPHAAGRHRRIRSEDFQFATANFEPSEPVASPKNFVRGSPSPASNASSQDHRSDPNQGSRDGKDGSPVYFRRIHSNVNARSTDMLSGSASGSSSPDRMSDADNNGLWGRRQHEADKSLSPLGVNHVVNPSPLSRPRIPSPLSRINPPTLGVGQLNLHDGQEVSHSAGHIPVQQVPSRPGHARRPSGSPVTSNLCALVTNKAATGGGRHRRSASSGSVLPPFAFAPAFPSSNSTSGKGGDNQPPASASDVLTQFNAAGGGGTGGNNNHGSPDKMRDGRPRMPSPSKRFPPSAPVGSPIGTRVSPAPSPQRRNAGVSPEKHRVSTDERGGGGGDAYGAPSRVPAMVAADFASPADLPSISIPGSPFMSPYSSPYVSPRGPQPGSGAGSFAGSATGSPAAVAAQQEKDRAKLKEIQDMFTWNQGTPVSSPRVGASAFGNQQAGPIRTPQVSDFYRTSVQEPGEFQEEEVTPDKANILCRPFEDVRRKYHLGKELGRGNFGVIRACESWATGERYACKIITKASLECWEDVEDVRREVEVLETVKGHPYIVSVIDSMEDDKDVHIIMELCEGGELFDRIVERKHYTERQAARVIRQVVEVLDYCHQRGLVHRDLKPENTLLVSKRSDTRVKVIDFGMAIYLKPGERCKLRAGTPSYIAPEVIAKNYGAEADVWSAGVMLYVMLCGLPPFWGETTEDVFKSILWQPLDFETEPWPSVSAAAKDLVRRMLCRQYMRRITVQEVLKHPWLKALG